MFTIKILMVALYVLTLVFIGWYSSRQTETTSDFFLGGRSIGPWLSAFAYGTTYFSAVIFIGYAGKIGWGFGLSSLWIVAGNALVGTLLAWLVLARRTREMTHRLEAMTMPEFLSVRYDSKGLKIISALLIFVFLVPYSASVYMGLSYMFEQFFNVPFSTAMFAMAIITAIYLIWGGYRAVALSDFIQGTIMIFGVFVLIYFVIGSPEVGGVTQGIAKLKAINPSLTAAVGAPGPIALFSLVILTSLGPWGLPQMTQKFYAIKSENFIKKAAVVSTIFAVIIGFGAYFVGSFSHIFFPESPPLVDGVPNADLIMPLIMEQTMPELAAVLILLLILSASMSTLASLVLVSSSAIAIDLAKGGLFPDMNHQKVKLLMRILCGVFIALSLFLALRPNVILTLMAFSWGTVAGAFLAPYVIGLFWQGATKIGAWAAMLSGAGISIVGSIIFPANVPTVGSIAMIAPLGVLVIVSLITPKFSEAHLSHVFGKATTTAEIVSDDEGAA